MRQRTLFRFLPKSIHTAGRAAGSGRTCSPDTVLVPLRQERYRRYVYMVTRPGLASSTAAAQLIRYNQGRAVRERGRQPRADGGTED